MSAEDEDDLYDPAEVAVTPAPLQPTPAVAAPPSLNATTTTTTIISPTPATAAEAEAEAVSFAAVESRGVRLKGLQGRVRSVCVNPAGTLLCAGGEDGQLCMWDFTRPSADGRIAATRVLTPFVNRIAGLQPIVSVHCSASGTYVVACQDGDRPALVEAGSGRQLGYCAMGERGFLDVVKCKAHRAPVTCSAPHATDDARFLTGAQDSTARLWDAVSFERGSVYAVKHGSGHLTESCVVESVLSLRCRQGCFATGATDGFVYVWDSRAKYRPGGHAGCWDAYKGDAPPFEKHVGGLVELEAEGGGGGAPLLAVRVQDTVKVYDARNLAAPAVVARLGGLPFQLDTTPLAPTAQRSAFLTCTSREGFAHVVGGHVVRASCAAAACTVAAPWQAGRPDEDVLCVCTDVSRADGLIFAGLSTGDVVVGGASADALRGQGRAGGAEHPFETWWCASRASKSPPQQQKGAGATAAASPTGRPTPAHSRVLGKKTARAEEDIADLF